MTSTASELIWLKQLLKDMGINFDQLMRMYCDNNSASHIVQNPVFHEHTKRIEVNCHFIREKVQAKEIETPFVRSEDQLADVFTKGLDPKPFEEITSKLELLDIYNPSLRGVLNNNLRNKGLICKMYKIT